MSRRLLVLWCLTGPLHFGCRPTEDGSRTPVAMSTHQGVPSQSPDSLHGAWERVALTEPDGVAIPDPPPSLLIFSPDGFYSVTAMKSGRPVTSKEPAHMTREELLARFGSVVARRGRYTVTGRTVTRQIQAHSDPSLEGGADVEEYRIEGGILTLTRGARVARYRRAQ